MLSSATSEHEGDSGVESTHSSSGESFMFFRVSVPDMNVHVSSLRSYISVVELNLDARYSLTLNCIKVFQYQLIEHTKKHEATVLSYDEGYCFRQKKIMDFKLIFVGLISY